MLRLIALIIVLPALAACPDNAIYVDKEIAPGMLVEAKIDLSVKRFRPGEVKVLGDIVIGNLPDETIRYSNAHLRLYVDSQLSRRTYLDSIASHAVDSGFVEIAPSDRLRLSVYWVLPDSIGRTLDERQVTLEHAIP